VAATLKCSKTGLVPTFLRALSAHKALAQQAQDAAVLRDALVHLARCKKHVEALEGLARAGELAEAVEAARRLEGELERSPQALARSEAQAKLKVRCSVCLFSPRA
jgi:hypothetical protein